MMEKFLRLLQIDRLPQNFICEIACAIGFGYTRLTSNRKSFPVDCSSILHAAKVFHLEQFAMNGTLYVFVCIQL